MTSQHSGIAASFAAISSQTSLVADSSAASDNGDSDIGETYTSPLSPSQFKKKKRTSKIWDHTPFGKNEIVRNTEGQIIWRCKYCKGKPAEYLENGGTAHIYKHLKSHNTLGILTPNEERAAKTRNHLEEAFSRMSQSANPLKRRRHDDEPTDLNADKFEQLYVKWIADCGVALRMATRETFRAVLKFLNPGVLSILPTSHQTIREWVMRTFETQKRRMRQVLQSAVSRIHFTVDLWSSPNKLGILGVVAHFIDSNGELVSYCVALREVHGRHSGENQAQIVMDVVEDYGIVTQVGYFVSDNADSNDTLMNTLQNLLNERHDILYDAKHHRLRCNGHTINLAAHAFMFPKAAPVEAPTKNKIKKETTSEYVKPSESDILKWRKAGPLGKLHNIVVFIRCSPQRIQRFKEISDKKGLLRDNDTRWNSKYYMTARAIELADQIDYFCSKEKDLKLDSLSEQDWVELRKVCNFLKSFADATKATEGHAHTIDRTLPIMDFLLSKFEAARIEYGNDAFMAPCVEAGWAKLDAYYTLTERSSAYVAAIVLSPHRKWHYFDVAWEDHPEWIESSKTAVEGLWKSRYAPVAKMAESGAQSLVDKPLVSNSFLAWEDDQEDLGLPTQFDEYQNYISGPRVKVKDVRKWWLEDTQQTLYPNLSKMALDLLSIPAMSAEPERLFSDTKITLQDRRNRLGIDIIEAIECIKSWSKTHEVAWVDDIGLVLDSAIMEEGEQRAT
ncbi:hypothetical protein VFPPC_18512 [Pochonia chlamydosporia 170]|uniref:HAT C-terminal dimerisation domain-containing protein n=1 Tax=Pochonia chlamydosporia 170 TaxID=1380566 RepID=A0A219ANP0_METCM|nr:hypothetical protein VFPPC_18512 [Pochonia chlamydosporia 170]OWT42457.1 hypothetical protein VFPPC_18512 [Pochonia chlamydosporia 170]